MGFVGNNKLFHTGFIGGCSGSTLWVSGGLGRGLSTGLRLFVWGFLIKCLLV